MPAQPCAPVDGVTMRNSLIGVPPRNAVSMFCAVTSTHEFGFGGVSDSVTTTPAWPRRFVVSVQPCTSQPPRPWPIVLKPPKFTESGSILPSGLRLKCTVAPETGFPKKSRTVSTQNISFVPFGTQFSVFEAWAWTAFVSVSAAGRGALNGCWYG